MFFDKDLVALASAFLLQISGTVPGNIEEDQKKYELGQRYSKYKEIHRLDDETNAEFASLNEDIKPFFRSSGELMDQKQIKRKLNTFSKLPKPQALFFDRSKGRHSERGSHFDETFMILVCVFIFLDPTAMCWQVMQRIVEGLESVVTKKGVPLSGHKIQYTRTTFKDRLKRYNIDLAYLARLDSSNIPILHARVDGFAHLSEEEKVPFWGAFMSVQEGKMSGVEIFLACLAVVKHSRGATQVPKIFVMWKFS